MTAAEVKAALYARHPATTAFAGPGPWTCMEEFDLIDFLAFAAWTKPSPARVKHARIGYEVKVSRGDMRAELLKPGKRAGSVSICHEFYFAVPKGMLTAEEIAYVEPEWMQEWASFVRVSCPQHGRSRKCVEQVPVPVVLSGARYEKVSRYSNVGWTKIPCRTCGGKGHMEKSRVEREAPTLWVPGDVGLIEVSGGVARCVKKAPLRAPAAFSEAQIGILVRWASYRPDPRHDARRALEQERKRAVAESAARKAAADREPYA